MQSSGNIFQFFMGNINYLVLKSNQYNCKILILSYNSQHKIDTNMKVIIVGNNSIIPCKTVILYFIYNIFSPKIYDSYMYVILKIHLQFLIKYNYYSIQLQFYFMWILLKVKKVAFTFTIIQQNNNTRWMCIYWLCFKAEIYISTYKWLQLRKSYSKMHKNVVKYIFKSI